MGQYLPIPGSHYVGLGAKLSNKNNMCVLGVIMVCVKFEGFRCRDLCAVCSGHNGSVKECSQRLYHGLFPATTQSTWSLCFRKRFVISSRKVRLCSNSRPGYFWANYFVINERLNHENEGNTSQ